MDSLLEPPEGISTANTLILTQGDPCQASDLQNCKIIHFRFVVVVVCLLFVLAAPHRLVGS